MIILLSHSLSRGRNGLTARYAERNGCVLKRIHSDAPFAIIKIKRHPARLKYAVNG